jgi:hypothetical protein
MLYPGKKDWWIVGLIALGAAAQLVGGGALYGVAAVVGHPAPLIPGTILLLVGGMLVWVLRGTNCEITDTTLIIRAGPFRTSMPLEAIEEVVPQRNWYGGPALEMNFGLAVMGIRVRYRKASGRLSWVYRIAPADRAAFLLELAERCPHLDVKDDGSLRRPTEPGVPE